MPHSELIQKHLDILRGLQTERGLFLASSRNVSTGYDKAWLRDNFYETLAFIETGEWEPVRKTFRAVLDIFLKHEDKIKWAAENRPQETWQYIHARYHPETFNEFWEEWGNKQNDAVGAVLFGIGMLDEAGQTVVENDNDKRIIQRLVDYLRALEYWRDPDSGMWEENEELHASSVGACAAGLEKIRAVRGIEVPDEIIASGRAALAEILPRESASKFTDLALLSLIWPYRVAGDGQAREILKNLEYHLDKSRGVVRYRGDRYYNANSDGVSEEAEWTMGFPWLAIIYAELANAPDSAGRGDRERAEYFFAKAQETISRGQGGQTSTIPELYYSNSDKPNENNPLGWAESLFVVAALKLGR